MNVTQHHIIMPHLVEEHDEYRLSLGAQQEANGEYMEALELYDKLLQEDPIYSDAHFNRGNVLIKLGQLEEAIESFENAVRYNPRDVEALHNMANALCRLSRFQEAIEVHEKVLKLQPKHLGSLCDKCLALFHLGSIDEAIQTLSQVDEINPFAPMVIQLHRFLAENGIDWRITHEEEK